MGVESNLSVQFTKPVAFVDGKMTGELNLSSEKTKKVSLMGQFSSFMKDLYSKVIHNETVRAFVSFFGHFALNVGETMAVNKVKEVIEREYPEKAPLYTAVAMEALGRTTTVAKGSLPRAGSIPDDLFKILCDSLTDYQVEALKRERQTERDLKIQKALSEDQ